MSRIQPMRTPTGSSRLGRGNQAVSAHCGFLSSHCGTQSNPGDCKCNCTPCFEVKSRADMRAAFKGHDSSQCDACRIETGEADPAGAMLGEWELISARDYKPGVISLTARRRKGHSAEMRIVFVEKED